MKCLAMLIILELIKKVLETPPFYFSHHPATLQQKAFNNKPTC